MWVKILYNINNRLKLDLQMDNFIAAGGGLGGTKYRRTN